MRAVDIVGALVRGRQRDRKTRILQHCCGIVTAIEMRDIIRRHTVVAHATEQSDEGAVFLAIDCLELDHRKRKIAQRMRAEEIGRRVIFTENSAILRSHYRRQLVQIADKDHLHAAERLPRMRAVQAQESFDAIEDIGAHHRYFVDHDGIEFFVKLGIADFAARGDLLRRHIDREVEEMMDRLAADIERGDACRRKHDDILFGMAAEMLQQGRFAGARFAGDEERLIFIRHQPQRFAETRIDLGYCFFFFLRLAGFF